MHGEGIDHTYRGTSWRSFSPLYVGALDAWHRSSIWRAQVVSCFSPLYVGALDYGLPLLPHRRPLPSAVSVPYTSGPLDALWVVPPGRNGP